MFYALNDKNERIYIKESLKEEKYYCPCCKGEMIRKVGKVNAHHFAHINGICDTFWEKENKGPWHIMLQDSFSRENQEIVVKSLSCENEYHIADVYLEGNYKDTIVEFQASPLSIEDFNTRNIFYVNNSRNMKCRENGEKKFDKNRLIWVFDCRDKTLFINLKNKNLNEKAGFYWWRKENKVGFENFAKITWNRPSKTFSNFNINNKDITIFLCVNYREYITEYIHSEFYTEDGDLEEHNRKKNVFLDNGSEDMYFIKLDYSYQGFKYCGGPIMTIENFINYINSIDEFETRMLQYDGFYPYNEDIISKTFMYKELPNKNITQKQSSICSIPKGLMEKFGI